MIDDLWPDLSGWHPLPEGGTIPAGMRYAASSGDCIAVYMNPEEWTPTGRVILRTERPVPAPLPTELGARIIAEIRGFTGACELVLNSPGCWDGPRFGSYLDDEIARWMPATEWRRR